MSSCKYICSKEMEETAAWSPGCCGMVFRIFQPMWAVGNSNVWCCTQIYIVGVRIWISRLLGSLASVRAWGWQNQGSTAQLSGLMGLSAAATA